MKYRTSRSRLSGKVGNKRLITDFLRRMRFGYYAICVQLYRIRLVRTRLVIVPLRLAASRIHLVHMQLVVPYAFSYSAVPCRFCRVYSCMPYGREKGGTPVLGAVVQVYQTYTKRYSSAHRPPLGLTLPAETSSHHYVAALALRSRMYVSAFALVVYWHDPSIGTPIAAY